MSVLGKDAAGKRIEQFLRAHPTGPLLVCVGSASVAGLAWLAKQAPDRRVTLLIGDLQSRNFRHADDAERKSALRFVQRSDVEVLNWYQTDKNANGRSEAHLKVWAVLDESEKFVAFLVGSANLTNAGLKENVEVVAVADATEHDYLSRTLKGLRKRSWNKTTQGQPVKDRLVEHISNPKTRVPTLEATPAAPAAQSGCGFRAAALLVSSVGLTTAVGWLLVRAVIGRRR